MFVSIVFDKLTVFLFCIFFSGSQSTEGYLWSGSASTVPYMDLQIIKSTYRFGKSIYI